MPTEQGFSNQKKKGSAQFKTVHNVGSDSFGTPSICKSLYDISTIDEVIVSVSDVIGSDGQVKFWKIEITSHGASAGNILRVVSGTIKNFEFDIIEIVDTNNFNVLPISPSKPLALDTARVMGWVTNKTSDTGSTLASITLPPDGEIIATNSSTTPLGAGGVFTGPAFEVLKYSVINVGVFSNVASATNGITVQFSPDGINWDHSHSTTYTAVTGVGYIFNVEYRFARVVYTNGATAQASFRLQTIGKVNFVKSSLYTIDQAVSGNMFVELGKNVIIGKTTGGGGGFVDVKVTPSGALTVEADVTGTVSINTTLSPRSKARIDFSSTNVTSGAWVELISTVGTTAIKRVQVFMSQGNALELGFGAAASEVSQIYLFPGGNEVFEMDIPAGTRLSVRAVSSTANSGELLVNLLG